jgi:UDP-glucose 4-epimerase
VAGCRWSLLARRSWLASRYGGAEPKKVDKMPRTKRSIVITGVSSTWGGRLAKRLAGDADTHVIGIDLNPPGDELKQIDFIQADVRNPLLAELFDAEGVDTVCHLAFSATRRHTERAFDSNVLGTMKLLGACAEARVRRVVLKSSTEVYGACSDNPALITEDAPLRAHSRYARIRYLLEIEGFCNNFQRQQPEVALTILRFANIVGPTAESPMIDLLSRPVAVTLLGFDPLMQLIHEDDVVEALVCAVSADLPGTFNVAAEGVLPLARILRLTGRRPLPVAHPLGYFVHRISGQGRLNLLKYPPFEPDYLRFPWVGDLDQMRTVMNFTPRYTAEEALIHLVEQRRLRSYLSPREVWQQTEDRLRDVIEARRQETSL